MFNIQEADRKRDVFESHIKKRYTDWRSEMRCKYITGTYKKDGKEIHERLPPWEVYPHITKDDWQEFVKQNSHPDALVSVYVVVVVSSFHIYVCIHI